MQISKAKRLVIKIGSSILIEEDNTLRSAWLASLAEDIAELKNKGLKVIIVSSGAVALGRGMLGLKTTSPKLEEKQACAACGQILLVQAWREALAKHQLKTAQVLLTIDDSENRRRYLNARNTLETLLAHDVIPVINENDTVATAELRFGDNDRLAARVAQMVSADMLVLFSDIDGLYTANPHIHADAEFINEVHEVTLRIQAMAGKATSGVGSGGMITKIEAAKIALAAGCNMAITAGKLLHPLRALQDGGKATWFIAASTPANARKFWISGGISSAGTLTVDNGAVEALKAGKSLLPAGVIAIKGTFDRGDAVIICDEAGKEIAKGLSAYSSDDAGQILRHKSHEIEKILGFKGRSALVHRDDLVLR